MNAFRDELTALSGDKWVSTSRAQLSVCVCMRACGVCI